MLPGALLMGVMSPITGKLFDKYGAKVLAITGMSIVVISTYFFSDLSMETTYLQIMGIYTIRMFGISMVMMPVMTNGLNTLPMTAYPHGTAMNNTLQQVSGAIGSALLITIMNTRTTSAAKDLALSGADPTSILKNSMLEGINYTFFISTFIAAIALLLTLFIKKPTRVVTEVEKDQVYKQQPVTES
jgi:hypothetical protein